MTILRPRKPEPPNTVVHSSLDRALPDGLTASFILFNSLGREAFERAFLGQKAARQGAGRWAMAGMAQRTGLRPGIQRQGQIRAWLETAPFLLAVGFAEIAPPDAGIAA